MIGSPEVIKWLAHRAGIEQLQELPFQLRSKTKALELNEQGRQFIETFGQRVIKGFVGFIDLVNFSERVKGWGSKEISEYLKPFLFGVINIAVDRYALVDKTIGDEVMLILPDLMEDGGAPAILLMGQILGSLYDLQRELGTDYPFRIGLAYGSFYVDQIRGKGYSEWTTSGEVVHLAKRLHKLKGLSTETGIGGAFGVLKREPEAVERFEEILNIIAGFPSRMTYEFIEQPVDYLKGVSPAQCALLIPKTG